MPHELVLRDHRAVQHAVIRTTAAGGAAGLLQAVHPGALVSATALFLIGCALVPPRSLRSAALTASLACLGAGAFAVGGWVALMGTGFSAALLYARDAGGAKRALVSTGAGAAALAAGAFVGEGIGALLEPLVSLPLAWLVAGGAAGFLAGLGVVGRELDVLPVPAAPPVHALGATAAMTSRTLEGPPEKDGELGELLSRAEAAAALVERSLGAEVPGAAEAAKDLLQRIAAFATRYRDIERQLADGDRAELAARRDRLAKRAEGSNDDVVRAEYQRAGRALQQQIDDLDAISGWQERALARLHHHVAVLERLRLAALHRRSAESGKSAEELQPLVDELSAASLDLDGAAEVLAELPA